MRKYLNALIRSEGGNAAVLIALAMTTIMGFSAFAVDLGSAYNEASKLQNALDSAALAAAQDLPADNTLSASWLSAEAAAIHYADANGVTLTYDDIDPVYKDGIIGQEIIGLRATKTMEVEYNFARVFGINSGNLTRSAAAGLTPAGGATGAVPLSITESSLQAAIDAGVVSDLFIKCSPSTVDIGIDTDAISGWFAPLRFDGGGASVYEYLLTNGYDGAIYVGQILDIENGNMSGPTLDGFQARFDACTHNCTPESHEPDCPRLVTIPVISIYSSSQVKVEAFAAFFITECGGNGSNSYIKGTYIPNVTVSNTAPGEAGADFGLYSVGLLD